MSCKALGSVALVLAAAGCSAATGALPSDPNRAEPAPNTGVSGNPRFFQVLPDDAFWVSHEATRDRVISGGARLEVSLTGEVLASTWEADKANGGDILIGGLALAPHIGGGYVFWTQARLFRATEFGGPLVPVGLGVADAADTTIRGVRNGLRGAMIATDAGPRELLPGATVATAFPDAGVTDLAALDASRAIRVDAFGRTAWTSDGGKVWNDSSAITGLAVRTVVASPDELWFETGQGRAILRKEGALSEPDGPSYRYVDYGRPFQIAFRGTRADRDDSFWWGYRELQPLQAAIASGVRLSDGTAFGVVRGAVARVALDTGKVLSIATDWLPNGIDCQPMQMGSSVLFACAWDDYQGGAYLLRADGIEPPHVERLFTDDGAFVTDDQGGLGYTGSCKAEPRFVDPDRYYGRYGGRYGGYDGEEAVQVNVQPVFCVRRGPEDWVERKLELDDDTSLLAWIPRKDGTAVALVRGLNRGEALPDLARDSQRETAQNGVRVVRVFRDVEGWFWPPQQARSSYSRGGGQQAVIDRRYRALDDGTIEGWVSTMEQPDSYQPVQKWAGASLREGRPTELHELPASPVSMAIGGPWGLLTTREGRIFETIDRGRSWRPAGVTALAPSSMQGSCSAQGCAFATGARIGWGTPAVAARITEEKRVEPPAPRLGAATLVCEPQGVPRAEQSTTSPAAATLGSQAKITIATSFGTSLELIRETPDALASDNPYGAYGGYGKYPNMPPPVATAVPSAAPSAKPKAKSASARTHTLVFRPPLEPLAPIVRHNATNAAVGNRSRSGAIPLLGATGEVSFLFYADQSEVIADRTDLVTMPLFDSRRYYYYGDVTGLLPGLRTASNRALLFGDFRRRASLEEHGAAPQKPPFFFTFDREASRRRALTMGRRDDGSLGVLVLDSAAPETAGVAPFDRLTSTLGATAKLAPWSSLATADQPACRADKKGYRAIVALDPSTWFALDSVKLPGVTLAKQGIALVRWSEERVCLEAIDVAVLDPRRRPDAPAGENLVVRWGGALASKPAGKDAVGPTETTGALRSLELMQPLTCSLRPASP